MILERLRQRRRNGDAESLQAQIAELTARNRERRDPQLEKRILELRHLAGIRMVEQANGGGDIVAPRGQVPPGEAGVPEIDPADLSAERVRAAILSHGCALVRGLIAPDEAQRLTREMDAVFEASATHGVDGADPEGYYEALKPQEGYGIIERSFVSDSGSAFLADSPRLTFDLVDIFERTGLTAMITEYLGERPALSANKCVLRRVVPEGGGGWHQDGAFLGNVKALNVWISLSRCGDVAPGLDIVPRRFEEIVETGTEGATFNWSVSPMVAEREAGEAGIVRPIFQPGDALLFDDRFLHSTAISPEMTETRYASESWFFAPSAYPDRYVPIAS